MGIHYFENKSVIIKRLQAVSGNKKSFVSTGTVDAHLQKLTEEGAFKIYGVSGATHKLWCDLDEDIDEGDQITIGDDNYEAVGVNRQDFGMNTHLEIILKKYDA